MKVVNIHSREYPVTSSEVGRLIDTLSSENDLLWPHRLWPRMKFDKPLTVSAKGGHGPIRYFVEEYVPGKLEPPTHPNEYLDHATWINTQIMERFNAEGIDFAFPTQTLHLAGDNQQPLTGGQR